MQLWTVTVSNKKFSYESRKNANDEKLHLIHIVFTRSPRSRRAPDLRPVRHHRLRAPGERRHVPLLRHRDLQPPQEERRPRPGSGDRQAEEPPRGQALGRPG